MTVTVDLLGLDAFVAELSAALDDELPTAMDNTAEAVAATARAEHPYTDRTGDLTASIQALPAQGSAMGGTLHGLVMAGTEYASFVEKGTSRSAPYPYLEPAAAAMDPRLGQEGQLALQRVVARMK